GNGLKEMKKWLKSAHTDGFSPKPRKPRPSKNSRLSENLSPKRETSDHKPQLLKNSRLGEDLSPKRGSLAQARDQKSEVHIGGFQQFWGNQDKSNLLLENDIPVFTVFSFMLLRGKATEDQLQFNPEIEKSAKSNRKKAKVKKKQGENTLPRRGGASLKSTILADSRPGENPSLKRGYQVKIFWDSRRGEKISPRRDIFAQARRHKFYF
ncbi:hypothetical protein Lal_00030161, partial [Lupinus albus]